MELGDEEKDLWGKAPKPVLSEKIKFSAKLLPSAALEGDKIKRSLLGRSFRVGWGPGGVLVLPRGNTYNIFQNVEVQKIDIQDSADEVVLLYYHSDMAGQWIVSLYVRVSSGTYNANKNLSRKWQFLYLCSYAGDSRC